MKKLTSLFLFLLFISGAKSQIINTIGGNGISGFSGDGGQATAAELGSPFFLKVDKVGSVYFADAPNYRVRKIDTAGVITTIAGNRVSGYSGDSGPATAAELESPEGIAIDASGNIYISDEAANRIRMINTSGIISTVAGGGISGLGDGGQATAAQLSDPSGICFDRSGDLYIADYNDMRIRIVNTSGIISTVAGDGSCCGLSGDGGPATAAELFYPDDVAVDATGNMYIVDSYNYCIRKVNTNGIISTIAGFRIPGYNFDGIEAVAAELYPKGIAVDAAGDLYIADYGNYRIRKIDLSGIITTVGGTGNGGFSGDGGPATNANIYNPYSITLDAYNNIYFSDQGNYRIRKITSPYTNFFVQDSSSNCTTCNGSATAYTGGGTPPYTYLWSSGGNTTSSVTGVCPDVYNVLIVDADKDSLKNQTIIVRSTILKDSTGDLCAGCCDCHGLAWIHVRGGTAPYTYSWSNGGTTDTIFPLSHGTYTVKVTDASGCTVADTAHVTNGFPASVAASSIRCFEPGNESATATGGTGYSWSPTGQTTATVTGLYPGTYIVTITNSDSSGCPPVQLSVNITEPSPLIVSAYYPTSACNIDAIITTLVVGGTLPYTYSWNPTGGTGATDIVNLDCTSGFFISTDYLTVTDHEGCTGNATVNLDDDVPIQWGGDAVTNVTCYGGDNGKILAAACGGNGSAPYTFTLYPPGTTSGSFNVDTISNLSAGTYTITLTNPCSEYLPVTVTITQPPVLSVTADSLNTTGSCNGSAWTMVSGGVAPYTYSWNPGAEQSDTITGECTGNYCCTITDASGCVNSVCVNIAASTGIKTSVFNTAQVDIYPNPNNGLFTITFSHSELVSESQTIIEIYNILGEKVLNEVLPSVKDDNTIDLTKQPQGVYFYRVLKPSGKLIGEGKLIIEK